MPATRAAHRRRRPISKKTIGAFTVTVQRCTNKPPYTHAVVTRHKGTLKRTVEYFRTKEEAVTKSALWTRDAADAGAKAATALTDRLKRDVLNWQQELAPYGKNLGDAVAHFLDHLRATRASMPAQGVIDALLAHKESKGKRERYQRDLLIRLSRFAKRFGERMIASIGHEEVENWLNSLGVEAVSWNNERRYLHLLWAFALSKGWATENIIKRIEPKDHAEVSPGILTIEQARALLNAADESMRAYYAIALFGGLRDAELKRLDWRQVNLLTGYITVEGKVAKTKRKRLVPITTNLKAWLLPVAKSHGFVTPANVDTLKRETCKLADITGWPSDATRHSFGTYEMARTKDIGHVSEVMGNSPGVVKKHYQQAVPFELGDEYFSIVPIPESGNIVVLPAAGKTA